MSHSDWRANDKYVQAHREARAPVSHSEFDTQTGKWVTIIDADGSVDINPFGNDAFGRWDKRHPSSQRFHQVLHDIGKTHDLKSQDYGRPEDPFANVRGSTEWGMPAWMGAMIRATDKLRRLQTYALKGELANESVRDAFIDLACYSAIGLVLFEEENEKKPDTA